ncbi:SH3 domain-containing protein [Archangium lipolyticum]|uniref:SH3 domain-containing protein n=1 Tax=Archangium lipolyticum TaxID=2970465 RepID=UPI0021499B18|nr:SH3 domain-containing protein [Archangium lipolyticum]
MSSEREGRTALLVVWLLAACACSGGSCSGAKGDAAQKTGGSEAAEPAALLATPGDVGAWLEAARKELEQRPADTAAQDMFERASLASEFHLLDEELKKGRKGAAPPLELEGCAGAAARDCIGSRIGRHFDSSWYRVELRGDSFLLLFFHARHRNNQDKATGNELVVFRGKVREKKGSPLRLDVVSRTGSKVSDAMGEALGRHANIPDPKGEDTLWGIRFEPLTPKEFALVDSLPEEWVGLLLSKNGVLLRFIEAPGDRTRFFIVREAKLRMAYLAFSERDGGLVPIPSVSRKGSTYHLGRYRLRWNPEDMAYLAHENEQGRGAPYIPAEDETDYVVMEPSPSEEGYDVDEEGYVPELVQQQLAFCGPVRSATPLKPDLYEVRCGCGSPCSYVTYVQPEQGRTSPSFWLPLAADAERLRVAISTRGQMPIRIVDMFDGKEWMTIRRPSEPTGELFGVVTASFAGGKLHLEYLDKRGDTIEEVVDLPDQPLPARGSAPVFIQGSEVNLRDTPGTEGEVVRKVSIGTECQRVKDAPDGWVRLTCGDVEGFTLRSLVSEDKPDFDTLLAQAQAPEETTKARLDAALRAAALEPQNEQALTLLTDLFFDANFEQLEKDRAKGGPHESLVVTRETTPEESKTQAAEAGLFAELEKDGYDWHQLRLRKSDFVSAMYREESLVVRTGRVSARKQRSTEGRDELEVTIVSRSSSPLSDTLKLALQRGARSSGASEEKASSPPEEAAPTP